MQYRLDVIQDKVQNWVVDSIERLVDGGDIENNLPPLAPLPEAQKRAVIPALTSVCIVSNNGAQVIDCEQ